MTSCQGRTQARQGFSTVVGWDSLVCVGAFPSVVGKTAFWESTSLRNVKLLRPMPRPKHPILGLRLSLLYWYTPYLSIIRSFRMVVRLMISPCSVQWDRCP